MADSHTQTGANDELRGTLKPGTRLRNYELISVLGHGGFGVTYHARDTTLGREVAIKEYLPTSLAIREEGTMVVPRSTQLAEDFVWGRDRFLAEARTLATLDGVPAVVRVFDFLEANGTAYMVMALVRGVTLEEKVVRGGPVAAPAIDKLLSRLLKGLDQVHKAGYLHRDIKPSNIILDENDNPTLIDFGSSRASIASRTSAMTAVFTPRYAAVEQLTSDRQGAWTDIYCLAATLYFAIAGQAPPMALKRVLEDSYEPLLSLRPAGYPLQLLAAIDAGLAVRPEKRPRSIEDWRSMMEVRVDRDEDSTAVMSRGRAAVVSRPRADQSASDRALQRPPPAPELTPPPSPSPRKAIYLGLAAAAVVLLAGGYFLLAGNNPLSGSRTTTDNAPVAVATPTTPGAEQQARAAEVKKQQEEEASRQAAARRQEEADRQAQAEARRQEQAAREAAELKKRQEEEDARRQAAAAQQEAERRAQADAARRAEELAQRQAELARQQTEAEARRTAEAGETVLQLSPVDRQRLQVGLTSLGFDTRGNDGVFGQRSREMITEWQKSRGVPATGFLSATDRQRILSEASTAVSRFDAEQRAAPAAPVQAPRLAAPATGSTAGTITCQDGSGKKTTFSGVASCPYGLSPAR